MIPLRDENPARTVAFVVIAVIVANVLVFLHEASLPPRRLEVFVAHFGLLPAEIVNLPSTAAVRSVFTSMFLHGGWMHLIGNMLFLWIFGNNIEDSVGHFRFVIFYLLAGIGAAAAQVAINPDSAIPMIGASGAISGVLGAYLMLFPRARVLVLLPIFVFYRLLYVPAWLMLIFWFGLQLLSGAMSLGADVKGGVAFWAHIGGFVAGVVLIVPFKRRGVRLFQ